MLGAELLVVFDAHPERIAVGERVADQAIAEC
jgi:hypothetical protein